MNKSKKKIVRTGALLLFIIYLIALLYFLFFSERYGRSSTTRSYRYNLVLFKEITRFIRYRHEIGLESFIVNIFGNVLAFVPYGFVLPIISARNRYLLHTTLLTFELTLMIEVLQLLLKVGSFDVDDIFMNTLGGILGYLLFAICRKIIFSQKRVRK